MTPLMWASKSGSLGLANFLCEHGAEVNAKSRPGMTALHLACKWHSNDGVMATLLLAEGADHTIVNNRFDSPLMLACFMGHLPAIQALMQADADVNFGSKGGITPLHYAARNNRMAVCRVLKLAGAKIHAQVGLHFTNCFFDD